MSGELHPGAYAVQGLSEGQAKDCVGPGWHALLTVLFNFFEGRKAKGPNSVSAEIVEKYTAPNVVRVKSKDGMLRVHLVNGNVFDNGVAHGIELASLTIKEHRDSPIVIVREK